MLNVSQVEQYCRERGYDLFGMGCPKTVDNDLFGTDHTPGFPSAARSVALSVLQAGILARDMQKVDQFVVYQTIGRDSGWLAAAAYAAKKDEAEAPHIILMPEVPFDLDQFYTAFEDAYRRFGFVSIICGEGIVHPDGTPVSASQVKDSFLNIEFGAMGGSSAALVLHKMITTNFSFRGEFQVPESLPMCAADRVVKIDIQAAVRLAVRGESGQMTTLVRASNRPYRSTIGTIPLNDVAAKTKPLPKEFIAPNGMMATERFRAYIDPLVGRMPEYARLKFVRV
jgi:6-phosphofructokinase